MSPEPKQACWSKGLYLPWEILILTCKTKTLGFQNLWSTHSVVSKLCLKVTRKYESLLDLAFLKVYPAKFYQVSDYRLSRASSLFITWSFIVILMIKIGKMCQVSIFV